MADEISASALETSDFQQSVPSVFGRKSEQVDADFARREAFERRRSEEDAHQDFKYWHTPASSPATSPFGSRVHLTWQAGAS